MSLWIIRIFFLLLCTLAGYAVTIVDPRSAFASEARFPGVALSTEWPDDAFETLRPDRRD